MSLTITAHGPHEPTVSLLGSGAGAFANLSTDGVGILIHTVAEADALIKAAVAAKDLLLAAQACGDIAEHTQRPCELAPGHEGWHRAGQIVWEGAPAEPDPTALDAAACTGLSASASPEPLPAGHGENHHDNAGHATHVTSGLRVAGCVTCEAGQEVAG